MRAAGFDVHDLPKIITPLDVKRTQTAASPLNAHDFTLLEDGVKTSAADRVIPFRDAHLGIALIVALDASGSMNGRPLAAIRKGLATLVSRKRPEDRVAVLSFADDTRWETTWNTSEQATQDSFRNLQTRGDLTRLYDALDDAINEFTRQSEKDKDFPIRRCILVISDGHDEGSRTTLAKLLSHVTISRVRLDTVGLAHSPLWLGSLRQIARTGFGEFQLASSPEALSSMLGQGIDVLLDMPALEFQAHHIQADGSVHKVGIDSTNNGVRYDSSITLPEPFWRTKWALYSGSGTLAAILMIVGAFLVWRRKKPTVTPHAATVAEVPTPSAPPAPPPLCAATVAEPGSRIMRPVTTAGTLTYDEPIPPPTAKPARVATVLAPHPNSEALKLRLTAVAGPYAGQTFPITEEEFWIGSAANNNLVLSADRGVSGNHACIRTEQTFSRLYDHESLNNTWLNGRPMGREIAILQPGDRVRIGACDFMVEVDGDS